jgi:hypothetical protein
LSDDVNQLADIPVEEIIVKSKASSENSIFEAIVDTIAQLVEKLSH